MKPLATIGMHQFIDLARITHAASQAQWATAAHLSVRIDVTADGVTFAATDGHIAATATDTDPQAVECDGWTGLVAASTLTAAAGAFRKTAPTKLRDEWCVTLDDADGSTLAIRAVPVDLFDGAEQVRFDVPLVEVPPPGIAELIAAPVDLGAVLGDGEVGTVDGDLLRRVLASTNHQTVIASPPPPGVAGLWRFRSAAPDQPEWRVSASWRAVCRSNTVEEETLA